MKRRLAIAALLLASMALSAIGVTGCSYRRADRSLVQPLALSKKQFNGEWHYMKTVYEAPYESDFFTGQGGWPLGKKIRFEITERYLYAFNASPNVHNTDSALTPVAAWPIINHFDIKPAINYSTGEPSNVITEEMSDGVPWYQRQYIRVSWERSVISDWSDIVNTYYTWIGYIRMEPAVYVPPEKVEIQPDYMSYEAHNIITSMYTSLYNYFLYEMPFSSYRVRFRYSFKKVQPSTYTPKEYTDYMHSKFGVFRTDIVRYHPDRGIVDWSYKFFANRHNLATQEEIDKGTKKPLKLTYYLSPDFPEEFKSGIERIANDWNTSFAYSLKRPAKDAQGKNAVFEIVPNNQGLPEGQRRELGDLRYNYVWWVNEAQSSSPLGYGPSLADADTGEIVHGTAYLYGAILRRVVDNYMVLFDMLSGRYTGEDITSGLEYFNTAFGLSGYKNVLGLPKDSEQKYLESGMVAPQFRLGTRDKMLSRLQSPDFHIRMQNVRKLDQSIINSQLSKITENARAKSLMLTDDVVRLAFPNMDTTSVLASSDPHVQRVLNNYHPVEMAKPHKLRDMLNAYTAPSRFHCVYMASYIDSSLEKYVSWHVSKGTPREDVRKDLIQFMFLSLTAHELGHTLGLMHNFKGSSDEYNYHNAYHDLKEGKTPNKCSLSGAACDPAKMDPQFFRTASVMDYVGEMYNDHIGVSKSDRAALAFIYGGLVEKAVNDPREEGELIKWSMDVERRSQDPADPLRLRPFRYCSDYFVGQDAFCQLWDSGHTAEEIVKYHIISHDRTYPLNYWRRGRRAFWPNAPVGRFLRRAQHMAIIYQDWAHRLTTQPGYQQTADFEDKLKAVQASYGFFMRTLTTPEVGLHRKDKISGMWERYPSEPDDHTRRHDVKFGQGRFFYSSLQDGYFGVADFRYRRIGTLYDKWIAMLALYARSWGFYNNMINWHYTNFHDLFTEDSTEFLTQGLGNIWNPNSNLVFKRCTQPLDQNGQCPTGANLDPIEPSWHPFLQYIGMSFALGLVNNPFHDSTFSNNMLVGIIGSGKSWNPPNMGDVQCPPIERFTGQFSCEDEVNKREYPVVCFNNFHNTRTYFAVQTNDKQSISYNLVKRACRVANQVEVLRISGADRSDIERKEQELEMAETVLTIMQLYVSLFN